MCKTVCTQYDLQQDWCTKQKDVWIDWVQNVQLSAITLLDESSIRIFLHSGAPNCWRNQFASHADSYSSKFTCSPLDLYKDKRATLNKESRERNIQQGNIRDRHEPSLAEFVDQHHFARSNNYAHDDFRYQNHKEGSSIFV